MHTLTNSPADALVRLSRRSLWTALILVTLTGASGMLQLLAPASPAATSLAMLLPVCIVIAVMGLRRAARPDAASMKVVFDDELRRMALGRGYRNGLFAVLIVQPLLAVGLAAVNVANALPAMAAATALTGALVFLGTVLYVDR